MKLKISLEKQCKIAGLPEPIQQFKFLKNRKFRIDFYFPYQKLAIEIEGIKGKDCQGIGGHRTIGGFISNMEKYNLISMARIFLLRFTWQEVYSGRALMVIQEFFNSQE